MPSVSVVIPTFKHRDYILMALDSVFAQTFTDYEVIVVDDGSPDDTESVLSDLIKTGRIQYVRQANAGQASARNAGISLARGEFIALLDDDDWWPHDKLQWQVESLQERLQAVLCFGQIDIFSDKGRRGITLPDGPPKLTLEQFVENFIGSPGQTLIRRSALEKIGGFDSKIWGADDWDLYLRLLQIGEFVYQPRIALHYRLHRGNASRNFWKMYWNGKYVIRKHFGGLARTQYREQAKRASDLWHRFICTQGLAAVQEARKDGHKKIFARLWIQVLILHPRMLLSTMFARHMLWFILPLSIARRLESATLSKWRTVATTDLHEPKD